MSFSNIQKWLPSISEHQVEWLMVSTALAFLIWVMLALFIYWRRAKTNLTPVDVPAPNRDASPDFLRIDHEKRQQALERGDEYAQSISSDTFPNRSVVLCKGFFGWASLILATAAIVVALMKTL